MMPLDIVGYFPQSKMGPKMPPIILENTKFPEILNCGSFFLSKYLYWHTIRVTESIYIDKIMQYGHSRKQIEISAIIEKK